jgi:hypothetical protein
MNSPLTWELIGPIANTISVWQMSLAANKRGCDGNNLIFNPIDYAITVNKPLTNIL